MTEHRVSFGEPPGYRGDMPQQAHAEVAEDTPWSAAVRAGWVPTLADVRAGYAARVPGLRARPKVRDSKLSAILVPVFEEAGRAHVVLIERSRDNGTHRGDIAFPGGVLRARESPAHAALRETEEEIGVPPADVELIACLDEVATLTAFLIRPYVALLPGRPTLRVDRSEVERVLIVPLADLARPGEHWLAPWGPDPSSRLHHFRIDDAVGWGTTGDLLADLLTTAAAGRARLEGAS
jgi:8-oxo-dGTP pyrophosphatase MutT (NUDIX family)